MASENETVADIVAEMKAYDPSSEGDSLRMFSDRIEAAWKRELLSKNAESDNSTSVIVSGGKQGNAVERLRAIAERLHDAWLGDPKEFGGYKAIGDELNVVANDLEAARKREHHAGINRIADVVEAMREHAAANDHVATDTEDILAIEAAVVRRYADDIESAIPDIIQPHGNAAAMREALRRIYMLAQAVCDNRNEPTTVRHHGDRIERLVNATLSAPPRNCDRFATVKDAAIAFSKLRNNPHPCPDFTFSAWLMSATEEGADA